MLNIKNIFIISITSLCFGGYSIYNILQYVKQLNNHYVSQIENLQNQTTYFFRKQCILENMYIKIKEEVNVLMYTVIELEKTYVGKSLCKNKIVEPICIENYWDNSSYLDKDLDKKDLKKDLDKDKDKTILEKKTLIDFDFAELINYEEGNSLKLEYVNNHHKHNNKNNSDIKELSWYGMAKLLFG